MTAKVLKQAVCVIEKKEENQKALKTRARTWALRVVSRDPAGGSLPSAMFGVQHGAHVGAGCTKIEALLRILVNPAGHAASLGRKL